jgi:hypothetical protein
MNIDLSDEGAERQHRAATMVRCHLTDRFCQEGAINSQIMGAAEDRALLII